jgi:hypothetical protein
MGNFKVGFESVALDLHVSTDVSLCFIDPEDEEIEIRKSKANEFETNKKKYM